MAAIEADRVVVALIGDTSKLDGPVNQSSRQFDRSMTTIEQSATRAEKAIVISSGRMANAQRNMGRQIADIGTQLAGGQSPFIILAQQIPQVADAATDMGGKMGRVASFLTSPWGAAALAATTVLVPLVAGLFKTGNEVDALVEKMRAGARQADLNRQADELWKRTVEGLTEAIRKRREEQEKSLQTDQQAEQQSLDQARDELDRRRDEIKQAVKEYNEAKARRDRLASDPASRGESGEAIGAYRQALDDVARLSKKVVDLRRTFDDAVKNVRGAQIPIGERNVESRVDAATAATNRYTAALGKLRDERTRGAISEAEFEKRLEAARRKRDADIKAAQDAARQDKSDKVTIALPVNGPVTSGFGNRARPIAGASTYHPAIDLGVPVGTPVSAGATGVVVYAGNLRGFGKAVIIDYGAGTIAQFSHLSALKASAGDSVSPGQVVALSGNSGISTGPHLDYRLRTGARFENGRVVGGQYVDPRKPVRVGAGDAAANAEDAARKAEQDRQKIADDFQKLMDDLEREGQQASDKIASDFGAVEDGIDPAAKIARDLQETLEKIEKARLVGITDDARAAELQLKATHKAAADLLGNVIHIDDLRAGGEVEQRELDDAEEKRKKAEQKAQELRRDNVYQLADLYEALFTGGTRNIWDEFKRQALRALAIVAAQATFRLIAGESVGFGGGGEGDVLASFAKAFSGRASGGYVGPGSIHRVNEHAGGVELLRMGPQGGTIIPLGQTRAASSGGGGNRIYNISVSADHSVTPAGFARDLAGQILREAQRMDAQTASATLKAVPAALGKSQRYGNP